MSKLLKIIIFILIMPLLLISCKGPDGKMKFPGADARKFPANPEERVKKNLEEGRGFRLKDSFKDSRGGVFDFASSNPMWRASLDVIEFMPLSSVNYSGGIIITDWYSSNSSSGESVKISIRFLSNEIRVDAIDINVFLKQCDKNLNCVTSQNQGQLSKELATNILRRAAKYKKEGLLKQKPYINKGLNTE